MTEEIKLELECLEETAADAAQYGHAERLDIIQEANERIQQPLKGEDEER